MLSPSKGNQGLMITPGRGSASIEKMDIRVGLFRDGELVLWYDKEFAMNATRSQMIPYWNLPERVLLGPGHEFTQVAIYTDEHGRQLVIVPEGIKYHTDSGLWMRSGGFSDYSSCVDELEILSCADGEGPLGNPPAGRIFLWNFPPLRAISPLDLRGKET